MRVENNNLNILNFNLKTSLFNSAKAKPHENIQLE